jgi:hypothetical protein
VTHRANIELKVGRQRRLAYFFFGVSMLYPIPVLYAHKIQDVLGTLNAVHIMVGGLGFYFLFQFLAATTARGLVKTWTEYYKGSRWSTPSGETVEVISADVYGDNAWVRFDDGDVSNFPLWLLEPLSGLERVSRPKKVSDTNIHLERVAYSRSQLGDGSRIAVRGVRLARTKWGSPPMILVVAKSPNGIIEIDSAKLAPQSN